MKPKSSLIAFLLVTIVLATACSSGAASNIPAPETVAIAVPETPPPPAATATRAPTPTPTELPFKLIVDVPYVPEGHGSQKLDIYLPQGPGPFPTLLILHNSAEYAAGCAFYSTTVWANQCRTISRLHYRDHGQHLAAMGYAVVIIDYRVSLDFAFPAPLEDAFCALAWLHANAGDVGFDTQRVAALGVAYGADLAALLGAVDDPASYLEGCPYALPDAGYLQGVITYSAIYYHAEGDMNLVDPSVREYVIGGTWREVPERYREASALYAVDGGEPPFLLIHSLEDLYLPIERAQAFAAALEAAGVTVETLWLPGNTTFGWDSTGHAPFVKKLQLDTVEGFLNRIFE